MADGLSKENLEDVFTDQNPAVNGSLAAAESSIMTEVPEATHTPSSSEANTTAWIGSTLHPGQHQNHESENGTVVWKLNTKASPAPAEPAPVIEPAKKPPQPDKRETSPHIPNSPHNGSMPERQSRTNLRRALASKLAAVSKHEPHVVTDIEVKLRAAEAKASHEAWLRAAAEAKAAEEAHRRATAEAKAEEEARLRDLAQRDSIEKAKEIEEAKLLVIAHAKVADQARAQVEKGIRLRLEAEKEAAMEAELQAEVEAREDQGWQDKVNAQLKSIHSPEVSDAEVSTHDNPPAVLNETLAMAVIDSRVQELVALAAQQMKLRVAAELKMAEESALRSLAEAKISAANKAKAELEAKVAAEHKAALKAIEAREKEAEKLKKTVEKVSRRLANAESKASSLKSESSAFGRKPKNAWFYTCEGSRVGPVSFQELRALAESAKLDPRLDMVWQEGMEQWKTAGDIDGLFEKKIRPSQPSPPPSAPFASIGAISHSDHTHVAHITRDQIHPGAGRFAWLMGACVLPVCYVLYFDVGLALVQKKMGVIYSDWLVMIVQCLPVVAVLYYTFRRLLDLGMNRWWIFGFLAPVLNLWLAYRCFACPSRYATQKKMDRTGYVLAFIYLAILGGCAFLATEQLTSKKSPLKSSPAHSRASSRIDSQPIHL